MAFFQREMHCSESARSHWSFTKREESRHPLHAWHYSKHFACVSFHSIITSTLWSKDYFTDEKLKPKEATILPFGCTTEPGLTLKTTFFPLHCPQRGCTERLLNPLSYLSLPSGRTRETLLLQCHHQGVLVVIHNSAEWHQKGNLEVMEQDKCHTRIRIT